MGDCGGDCGGCACPVVPASIDTIGDWGVIVKYLHPTLGLVHFKIDHELYCKCFGLADGLGRGRSVEDFMGSKDVDLWPHFEKSSIEAKHDVANILRLEYDQTFRSLKKDLSPLLEKAELALTLIIERLNEDQVWTDRHLKLDISTWKTLDQLRNVKKGLE